MFELTENIYTILSTNTALQTALGAGYATKIAPLIIENQDETPPFIVFEIHAAGVAGKDGVKNYTLIVRTFDVDHDSALQLAEKVEAAFMAEATLKFGFISAKPILDENYQIHIEQIYKLKK